MIVPNKFFHTKAATQLRDFLAETESDCKRLLTLATRKFFGGQQTTPALFLWSRDSRQVSSIRQTPRLG